MDLSNQSSIGSALLISIAVPDEPVTYFSTYWRDLTVDGNTYTGLGSLMSLTGTQNDLRISEQNLTIVISGIPAENISLVRDTPIKGSPIVIKRYVFNPITGIGLAIADNPTGRFHGIVTNWGIDFSAATDTRSAEITISLECSTQIEVLANKINGRRTNPEDQRRLYPTDFCFDQVPRLAGSNIDFGVPKP